MSPLLGRGYILTLDMIFTPQMNPGESFTLLNTLKYVLYFLAKVIQADLIQKGLLLFLFFLIGFSGFKLIEKLFRSNSLAIIAGTLYLINPFVYERFLAGHWLFLYGYALTPIFIILTIDFFDRIYMKENLKRLLIFWILIAFISTHHFLLFEIIFLIFSLFDIYQKVIKPLCSELFKFLKKLQIKHLKLNIEKIFIKKLYTKNVNYYLKHTRQTINSSLTKRSVFVIAINIVWIILVLIYNRNLQFTSNDLLYFGTSSYPELGLIGNVLTFNGFFAERTVIKHIFSINYIGMYLWVVILIVAGTGFIAILFRAFSRSRQLVQPPAVEPNLMPLLIITIIGFLFSLGSYGFIGKIYRFLMDEFLFLTGMREPQKFLNLYIIGFIIFFTISLNIIKNAILVAIGNNKLNKKIYYPIKIITTYFLILFIIFSSYPLLFGANGQLELTDFPDSYNKFEKILKKEQEQNGKPTKVLILPWEAYSDFSWVNRRIANPGKNFFDAQIISNIKLKELYDIKCDIELEVNSNFNGGKYVSCFNFNDPPEDFHKQLKLLNIKYVMLNDISGASDILPLIDLNFFKIKLSDKYAIVYETL